MRTSNGNLGNYMRKKTTALRASPDNTLATQRLATASDRSSTVVIVDPRRLVRESLAFCIGALTKLDAIGVQCIDEWIERGKARHAVLFVLGISSSSRDDAMRKVQRMLEVADDVPTAVFFGEDDVTSVMELLGYGVRGCIPKDTSLDVAIAALGLIRAGGTFVPAGSVMKSSAPAVTSVQPLGSVMKSSAPAVTSVQPPVLSPNSKFTSRQVAVINELRLGKPNKLIAYTLAMRESTVKVHVRNIMKKINAKNRTEVAVLTNQMLKSEQA